MRCSPQTLLEHPRPFEDEFKPGSRGVAARSRRSTGRRPRIACWCSACMAAGRRTANCRRCAKCAAFPSPAPARRRRISPSTRWRPNALRRLRASRRRPALRWKNIDAAFAEYGRLIAKPARDGSSYGLIFVNAKQDLVAVRNAAKTEEYLIEPFVSGVEATCGVLEQSDGSVISLPPIEIVPAEGGFDYTRQISAQSRRRRSARGAFRPRSRAQLQDQALRAHRALSCTRLFPHRLHRLGEGTDLSRNQHPAGPDQGLALPEGAEGAGHRIRRFPARPDRAGEQDARRSSFCGRLTASGRRPPGCHR